MWLIVLISILALVFYFVAVKPFNYWKNKGVPYIKPLPFVGNVGPNLLKKISFAHLLQKAYNENSDKRYLGIYQFLSPMLLVRDPELIKTITVKEFDTFPEHRAFVPEDVDPLWSKNIFAMRGGERWHNMRAMLSPSFTSSKLRMMFDLMKDCAKQFTAHFQKQDGVVGIEMKDAFTRFTNDVIATTAFGINCNSLKHRQNEFYVIGREATNFTGIRAAKFFLSTISPSLCRLFKIGIFTKKVNKFFRGVIIKTIRVREEKGIVRPDMIHLLMQARKGRSKNDDPNKPTQPKVEITDEDITAQALVFFFGGFDTSSTFMCFAAYELAVNPDVQEKLRSEILTNLKQCNGDITYEALLGMKYMDMVVSETLRKWPPASTADRISVKPFTLEPKLPGEKLVTVDAGINILIPTYALHWDPQYFPDPEKFDPDRFTEENKTNIKPFTYMPFGMGPRNCIGSRFALLEGKLILAEILSKFEIVPVEKTQIPIQLDKSSYNILPENGLWLSLKPLSCKS